MERRRHRGKVAAAVGLIAAYFLLQSLASRLDKPHLALEDPHRRPPFPVDVTLPDVRGQTVDLTALRGRPVLVNLWATWCFPCRTEMPSMQTLYDAYRQRGFVIVAIASDIEGRTQVAPFVHEYGLTFSVLLDPQNAIGTQLRVPGIPTTYVLDKQGRIASMEVGARNWNAPEVRQLIETLLAEPARESR